MPTFQYKAKGLNGVVTDGFIEAYDEFEAIAKIRESSGSVIAITQMRESAVRGLLTMELGSQRLKDKTLAMLCSQFAAMLKTGLPLVRVVELLGEQTSERPLKKLLGEVAKDVSAGYGLAQSFEQKGGKLLPQTFVETVRAAEQSGTLETAFARLATYYDNADKTRSKVHSALAYPTFLLLLAALVVAVIMLVVMPRFEQTFASLGAELPGLTRGLIAVAHFLAKWWWLIGLVLLGLAVALRFYIRSEQGGLKWDKFWLHVPLLGHIAEMKASSQFASTLSTLLTAGLPMVQSVSATAASLDNRYLAWRLGLDVPHLEEGRRLAACMAEDKDFPPLLTEMVAMGEETGALEETLATIGAYYDNEVETSSKRALDMLQPAITVLLGLVIGVIVIALYLPMFSMYVNM